MPEISSDKTMAATYPPKTLYESWGQHADSLNMSTSQFIIRMVEAGRKQIDVDELADESAQELSVASTVILLAFFERNGIEPA
jgi:hypothetical protein